MPSKPSSAAWPGCRTNCGGWCGPGWTANGRPPSPKRWRPPWAPFTTCTTGRTNFFGAVFKGSWPMHQDLLDLLKAVRGEPLKEARRVELLARLRADEAFRREFVNEILMLGMLKAVQATEPRWLVLEDELGWSADERS